MQSAINMHSSQIGHGKVTEYPDSGLAIVVVGYTPSMVKLYDPTTPETLLASWYDWMTAGDVVGLHITEDGFKVEEAEFLTGFIFETYGCANDSSYRAEMHPDPVEGDNPMPFIHPVVEEELES
jgi:hypothetical protein